MATNRIQILLEANDKASKKVKGLENQVKKFSTSATGNIKRIQTSTERLNGAFRSLGQVFIAAGLFRGFQAIVKTAIDFESAFAGVRKTVDATEKEFFQLSEALIDMSKRIPVAAEELAGIQEIAGQLGIRGVDNLTSFTEAIAKIAVTTNLTQEAAATSFARISAVIGEPIENIENMASAVVALGNQFPVTETEIVTFAQRIAGMGKVAKLTTDEIFGISAAFASVGIQAELGGTAINRVLLDLTAQGKTGAEEFVKFVNTLVDGSEDVAGTLKELGLTSARSQQAFLNLAGAGGQLEKALRISNKGFVEANALNEEAQQRFGTTASKIQLTKNNVAALSIELGDILLPALNNILISANFVAEALDRAFGPRKGPEDLESSLIERIKLLSKEEVFQREIIQFALGNAGARADAEERINEILVERARAFNTLNELRFQRRPIEGPEEGPLDFDGTGDVSNAQSILDQKLEQVRQFQIDVQTLSDEELASKITQLEDTVIASKSAEESITAIIVEESKKRTQEESKRIQAIERRTLKMTTAIEKGFSTTISSLVRGSVTAKEAFSQLGQVMIKAITDFLVEQLVAATVGKALQTASTAFGVAQAAILASAWQPAAVFASIATAGGAAVAGTAGIVASFATATTARLASAIPGVQDGGIITSTPGGRLVRIGEGGQDEAVIPLSRAGVRLGENGIGGGGETTINIFIEGGINSEGQTAEELGESLGFEVERALKSGGGF